MRRPAGRGSIPGLARQIREAHHKAGLSQANLADELGVRQSSVGQWERGATTPTLGMFRRVVAVLGPWPLLEVLMPSDQPQSAAIPPGSRRHQVGRSTFNPGQNRTPSDRGGEADPQSRR